MAPRVRCTRPRPGETSEDIINLAVRFGRYGYRRITALLRDRGGKVNHKRVERIWRREGLKLAAVTAVRMASGQAELDLNVWEDVYIYNLLNSVQLLNSAVSVSARNVLQDWR
jgi:hypothetical protein